MSGGHRNVRPERQRLPTWRQILRQILRQHPVSPRWVWLRLEPLRREAESPKHVGPGAAHDGLQLLRGALATESISESAVLEEAGHRVEK